MLLSNIVIYYTGYCMSVFLILVFFTTKKLYFNFICIYLAICAIITNILFKKCLISKKKYVPYFYEALKYWGDFLKKFSGKYINVSIIQYLVVSILFSIKVLLIYNKYI